MSKKIPPPVETGTTSDSGTVKLGLLTIIAEHKCERGYVVDRMRDDRDQQVWRGINGDQRCQIDPQKRRQNSIHWCRRMRRSEGQIGNQHSDHGIESYQP